MVSLEELQPFVLGPLRERILAFEETDWCCRQAALYVTYLLRHLGHAAVMVEGLVEVEAAQHSLPLTIQHSWTYLPYDNVTVDLMITQANWIGQGIKPCVPVEPVWGDDPPYIHRSINRIWNGKPFHELLATEHWRKPGVLYQTVCDDLLAFAAEELQLEGFVNAALS